AIDAGIALSPPPTSPHKEERSTPSAWRQRASNTRDVTRRRWLEKRPTIAVIGGTGELGSALAKRWAVAGYPVVLGSRSKQKAQVAAEKMSADAPAAAVTGEDNRTAAAAAEIVIIAVPYASHESILDEIKPAVAG